MFKLNNFFFFRNRLVFTIQSVLLNTLFDWLNSMFSFSDFKRIQSFCNRNFGWPIKRVVKIVGNIHTISEYFERLKLKYYFQLAFDMKYKHLTYSKYFRRPSVWNINKGRNVTLFFFFVPHYRNELLAS